jgi:hypothetical protein
MKYSTDARLELDRLALRHEQGLAAGVAVRPLGDAEQRHLVDAELGEDLAGGIELAAAAVDDDGSGHCGNRSSSPGFLSSPSAGFSKRLKRRCSTSRIMA